MGDHQNQAGIASRKSINNCTSTPSARHSGNSPTSRLSTDELDTQFSPPTASALRGSTAELTSKVGQASPASLWMMVLLLDIDVLKLRPTSGSDISTNPIREMVNSNPQAPGHLQGTRPTSTQAPAKETSPAALQRGLQTMRSRALGKQALAMERLRPRMQKKRWAQLEPQYLNSQGFWSETKLCGIPLSKMSMSANEPPRAASTSVIARRQLFQAASSTRQLKRMPMISVRGQNPSQGQPPPTSRASPSQSQVMSLQTYQTGLESSFISLTASSISRQSRQRGTTQLSLVLGLARCSPERNSSRSGRQNETKVMKETRDGNHSSPLRRFRPKQLRRRNYCATSSSGTAAREMQPTSVGTCEFSSSNRLSILCSNETSRRLLGDCPRPRSISMNSSPQRSASAQSRTQRSTEQAPPRMSPAVSSTTNRMRGPRLPRAVRPGSTNLSSAPWGMGMLDLLRTSMIWAGEGGTLLLVEPLRGALVREAESLVEREAHVLLLGEVECGPDLHCAEGGPLELGAGLEEAQVLGRFAGEGEVGRDFLEGGSLVVVEAFEQPDEVGRAVVGGPCGGQGGQEEDHRRLSIAIMADSQAINYFLNPKPFLEHIIGRRVRLRLKWGWELRGLLKSSDPYMNVHLGETEEWIGEDNKGLLGEVLVRCNNILYVQLLQV